MATRTTQTSTTAEALPLDPVAAEVTEAAPEETVVAVDAEAPVADAVAPATDETAAAADIEAPVADAPADLSGQIAPDAAADAGVDAGADLTETLDALDAEELAASIAAAKAEADAQADAIAAAEADAQAERDHKAAHLRDLEQLMNEVGRRTAGATIDADCIAYLKAQGAKIHEGDQAAILLAGVVAISQYGLHRAALDWCMNVARKLMAEAA